MKRYANAKVNLALDVLGINQDDYHDLDMIMAPISLSDTLDFKVTDQPDHQIYFDGILQAGNNTVRKALEVLAPYGLKNHYQIDVTKHIPMEAGLAGGSADAACVLHTINELESLNLSAEQLLELGAAVGADVPFCLTNQTARVQGIGEKVRPLPTDLAFYILLVKPEAGVSTPACFKKWDAMPDHHYDIDIVEVALKTNNMDLLYQTMENALEAPAFQLLPQLQQVKDDMLEAGLVKVLMTGSGSAMMGFSIDYDVLQQAREKLLASYPFAEIVKVG